MYHKYSKQEKFDMIMACRSSGQSDYQWCKSNGICPSTFYGWIKQLKQSGINLPEPSDKDSYIPASKQDIVKLEIVDDISLSTESEPLRSIPSGGTSVIEIEIGQAKVKITNDVNPNLLAQIITGLGGYI